MLDLAQGSGFTALVVAAAPMAVSVDNLIVWAEQASQPIQGLPARDNPRLSAGLGAIGPERSAIAVELLTLQEALQLDLGVVGSRLTEAESRTSIEVTASITGGSFSSNELAFTVELCRGCLGPVTCDPGQTRTGQCFTGQDTEASCVDIVPE